MHSLYGKIPISPSLISPFNPPTCGYNIMLENGDFILNEDFGQLYLETLCTFADFSLLLEDGFSFLLENGAGDILLEG